MSFLCENCNAFFETGDKFCSKCGKRLVKKKEISRAETLNIIIGFYVTMLIFIAVTYFANEDATDGLYAGLIIEILFAVIVVVFSVLDYKAIVKLYSFKSLNWKAVALSIIIPLFSGVIVYYLVGFLESLIGNESNYYATYSHLNHSIFWAIFFIAVLPSIFEELAFRGFLFNKLNEVANIKITIIATSFLFALIHFSFISFLWIFPFGLLLGYLRAKYNTLWLGMIVHFIHNLVILVFDIYYFSII